MASVICPGYFDIDYSIVDGRIRSFELNTQTLYAEGEVDSPEWREQLLKVVKEMGLDQDRGMGLHAFVLKWKETGEFAVRKPDG